MCVVGSGLLDMGSSSERGSGCSWWVTFTQRNSEHQTLICLQKMLHFADFMSLFT